MIIYSHKSKNDEREYIVNSSVTMEEFYSMIKVFEEYLEIIPNFISAPEAEFEEDFSLAQNKCCKFCLRS